MSENYKVEMRGKPPVISGQMLVPLISIGYGKLELPPPPQAGFLFAVNPVWSLSRTFIFKNSERSGLSVR